MSRGFVRYVAKRLGFAALMLAGVSVILFTLMRLAPGGEFSQEVAAQVRERLGLDRPLENAPYVLYFPQQVYVTRQAYEGFIPIPAYGGIYQSMKSVRWTGR